MTSTIGGKIRGSSISITKFEIYCALYFSSDNTYCNAKKSKLKNIDENAKTASVYFEEEKDYFEGEILYQGQFNNQQI